LNLIYTSLLREFEDFFFEEEEDDDDQMNNIESIMSSGNDLNDMKKLNQTEKPLFFLIQMIRISKQFWVANKLQSSMIDLCKKELPIAEKFIRGWVVTKIKYNLFLIHFTVPIICFKKEF
jgi:hypothetical protein